MTKEVVTVSFSPPLKLWSGPILDHLSKPLLSNDSTTPCNVVFVCTYGEEVPWNGLPYLASMSSLFQPRTAEEQYFTVHLPDYEAGTVRKLLLLISKGVAILRANEVPVLNKLAKDLSVS